MEIYKKVEYIHKDKAQKIYIGYSRKVYYGFFKEMPLDKLKKADKLQRNRSRQRRSGKTKIR
jgi:hypothetical protein